MFSHRHFLSILVLSCILVGVSLAVVAGLAIGATAARPAAPFTAPGPLPNDCQDVTVVGEEPPVCCAFGYVYYDGVPVTGAQVTIQSASGTFTTTTTTGPASVSAYYAASLSASPLSITPGDTITITAVYGGASRSTTYQVVSAGQQVDVVLTRPLSSEQLLTAHSGGPAWHPGSSKIAVHKWRDSFNRDICVVDVHGGNETCLTSGGVNENPSFSPDGSRIAFSRHQGGDEFDIHVMNASNGNILLQCPAGSGNYHAPQYSPDGSLILFSHWPPGGDKFSVGVMNAADCSNERILFPGENPRWSRDGSKILFNKKGANSRTTWTRELGDTTGATEQQLTYGPCDAAADFSPSGAEIVFARCPYWGSEDFDLYTLNLATGALVRLTADGADDEFPAWSPDGSTIAYVSNRSGEFTVWTLSLLSMPPIATINYIHPNPAQPGQDTVAFAGSGSDQDEGGAAIVAWEWASSLDGVLSTQEDFLLPASNLSVGTHTISFRVQDDEGEWSAPVIRSLQVGDVLPTLTINDVTILEGNAGTADAVFTVTLSAASSQQVTVNYATADGSATAGSDYVAISGTLVFSPGATTRNVTVVIIGDTLDEPNETFQVALTSPTNALIADGQGIGTITDDDAPPVQCPVILPWPPSNFQVPDEYYYRASRGYGSGHYNVVGHEVWRSPLQDHSADQYIINTDSDRWWIFVVWNSSGDHLQTLLLAPAGTPNAFDRGTVVGNSGLRMLQIKAYVEQCPGSSVPDITVTPSSVSVTLPQGQSTSVPLTIRNAGNATLTFTITEEAATAAIAASAGRPLAFPTPKVDPALLEALNAAPDGQATFFVYLDEQADLSAAHGIADRKERRRYVYRTLQETARRTQASLLADLRDYQRKGELTKVQPFWIVNALAVTAGRSTVDALTGRPDVVYLELEPVVQIPEPIEEASALAPQGVEWGVSKIGADRARRDFGVTGDGILFANIDTGVDYVHPALIRKYRGTATGSHDYNWYDPTGTYPSAPGDNNGHGTHTMGTMVGDDGAANQVGVAPGAQWIAVKGCASSSCMGSDLLKAAQWIVAPCPIGVDPTHNDPRCDPDKAPDIVNNSWGGYGGDPWYLLSVQRWRDADILPAFSAGNYGGDSCAATMASPGDYAESFATGATDSGDVIAWWSSKGPSRLTVETKPNVVAPGYNVRSALPGGGYGTKSGTSMASPHTAGAAALILDANPNLSVDQVEALLMNTAVDLGQAGPDCVYGYGRIDAYAAVAQANDVIPWLSAQPASGSVAAGGEQIVTLTLDAAGLDVRGYTANLVITSNDPDTGRLVVPVSLSVTSAGPQIAKVTIANLRDVSASVSWITTLAADGEVRYGTNAASLVNVAYDDRGAGTRDDVHHVTLSGLAPLTTYYFFVRSDGVPTSTRAATTR